MKTPIAPAAIPYAPCRGIGDGVHHCFAGDGDRSCWDRDGRLIAVHRAPGADPDSRIAVGYVDTHRKDRFHAVGETAAWDGGTGSRLQWLPGAAGRRLIYNDRTAGAGPVSVVVNIDTGARRTLSRPIDAAAPDGRWALSVDRRRWHAIDRAAGSGGEGGPADLPPAPADDGIWRLDLGSDRARLLVGCDALARFRPHPSMDRAIHGAGQLAIDPTSSRVLFLHRWIAQAGEGGRVLHRLLTMRADGSDLRLLDGPDRPRPAATPASEASSGSPISHPAWQDASHAVAWRLQGDTVRCHRYRDAPDGEAEAIGAEVPRGNGPMAFSPADAGWLAGDVALDAQPHRRALFLLDLRTGRRRNLGRFEAAPAPGRDGRRGLHPRWSPDGRQLCIDSVHEGMRRIYLLDVSAIV